MDAVILSAGRASRFGLPKFLLPAGPGYTLLTKVLKFALQTVNGRVVVVVGREGGAARYAVKTWLRPANAPRVHLVTNPDYAAGLSTSLKRGVGQFSRSEGLLVLLADQPALNAGKLYLLRKTYQTSSAWAVSAAENGVQKPPVCLGPALFSAVKALEGDQGAKDLLRRYAERVQLVEWGPGDWFTDVDTWETYRDLIRSREWDKEEFVPLEALSSLQELEARLESLTQPQAYLETLRRGVLTLLNQPDA